MGLADPTLTSAGDLIQKRFPTRTNWNLNRCNNTSIQATTVTQLRLSLAVTQRRGPRIRSRLTAAIRTTMLRARQAAAQHLVLQVLELQHSGLVPTCTTATLGRQRR